MLIPYLSVVVKQNAYTSVNVTVPPHELAVLSVIFGQSAASKVKARNLSREVDPYEEYQRLIRKYGNDSESKRPWVEITFGRFPEGRFERTMKEGAKHYFKSLGLTKNGTKKADKPSTKDGELSPQQRAANTRAANKLKAEQDETNAKEPEAAAE